MANFYGRDKELQLLKEQLEQRTAKLIVIRGRRRIGKSRLAEKFQGCFEKHYTFVGIPPQKNVTAEMQRQHFANDLERQTGLAGIRSDDWDFLFHNLSQFTKEGRVLITFDEINWMGTKDPAFLGKLKTAWDIYFKKNDQLIMLLSGSMASWIQENVLASTGFFGRIDLDLILKELPLNICDRFWDPYAKKISAYEKFKILCVTGGVPRYLESINPKVSAEENIRRLFFRKEALFFKEFDRIFTDVFFSHIPIFKKIVQILAKGDATQADIFSALGVTKSGIYSSYLDALVEMGYLSRHKTWNIKEAKLSKLSLYRLSDNYLRFYLRYIEPIKENILRDNADIPTNWHSIMGIQFENLVLNNRKLIYRMLGIQNNEVSVDNPYFVRATKTHPGLQIDYMIQTKFNNLFLCEIKFHQNKIGTSIIEEMNNKLKRLQLPRGFSIRTVLIHVNGVTEKLMESNYFDYIIDFSELLAAESYSF